MDLIKHAKNLSKYCKDKPYLNGIYETLTETELKAYVLPLGPLNTVKLTFYIFEIINNRPPEKIIDKLDNNLQGFNIVSFSSSSEITIDCDACYGSGRENCEDCDGDGSLTCDYCDGDGLIDDDNDCSNCGGDGDVDCQTCGGDGDFICYRCDGRGYVDTYGIEFYVESYITYDTKNTNLLNKITDISLFNTKQFNNDMLLRVYYIAFSEDNAASIVKNIKETYLNTEFLLERGNITKPDDLIFTSKNKINIKTLDNPLDIIEYYFT